MPKRPFIWEPGDDDLILTGQGGMGVIGQLIATLPLGDRLNASTVPDALHPDISHRDVAVAYLGLLVQGTNDFDHIETLRDDDFFALSLGLSTVPSSPTIRQRFDQAAEGAPAEWLSAVADSVEGLLRQHIRSQSHSRF